MKYLKTFEYFNEEVPKTKVGQSMDYEVGDLVVATETNKFLQKDKKYRVLKLYKTFEDKYLNNPWMRVDVEDIETGEVSKGWKSDVFKVELEFDSDKFNI